MFYCTGFCTGLNNIMLAIKEKTETQSKPIAFDRERTEKALNSGGPVKLPQGLSREEKRQFIINSN